MTAREHDPAPHLLAARYGTGGPVLPAPAGGLNAVLETLLSHRSVRAFAPDQPLAEGTLEWLVAAAQSAASSSNLQTWSVVAVEDTDRRARLSALVGDQASLREAPLVLVWIADLARLRALAAYHQAPLGGEPYLDTFLMAVIDATLAAQNAAAAAESLGLGTCYIGGIRNRSEAVAEELGLVPGTFAVFGLVVGHPDPARPAAIKPRLPHAAVLSRERFTPTAPEPHVADYERTLAAFQVSQSLSAVGWTQPVLTRLRGPDSLNGRHRLVEALGRHDVGLR